jgi:Xaa-Pro dipeptidase
MIVSKREFVTGLTALSAFGAISWPALGADLIPNLAKDAKPIDQAERLARIAKAQALMKAQNSRALLVESGSSLDYFTGIQWWRSERVTAAVIPVDGPIMVITPHFEEPSVRESLGVPAEVRPWHEHENPFAKLVDLLTERGISDGEIMVESTTRFFIVDGLNRASGTLKVVSGDPVVKACRMIKSPAELNLMQIANDITLAAMRLVRPQVKLGMTQKDIGALMAKATRALGGGGDEGGLVLLNEASAYPHGSHTPQTVRQGSVILLDFGCKVHGYQSDISRSFIFGKPSERQRKVWDTVKRGQELVMENARIGLPVGQLDEIVRKYYESQGWGPDYQLPGLSHRTGHGIGMDGHEAAYLVRSDLTPLAPGMCFSNEPGLYIPGEFGIRLEDCWYMTQTGPKLFTGLAKSIDDPI